jgi:hypothetical protein
MGPRVGSLELLVILIICIVLLVIIGLVIFLVLRNRPGSSAGSDKLKKCPYCAELIKAEAVVCRFCGRDQPPLS